MKKFTIEEHATYEVEAETAQAALDAFLQNTNGFPCTVNERAVFDERGSEQEVDDSGNEQPHYVGQLFKVTGRD